MKPLAPLEPWTTDDDPVTPGPLTTAGRPTTLAPKPGPIIPPPPTIPGPTKPGPPITAPPTTAAPTATGTGCGTPTATGAGTPTAEKIINSIEIPILTRCCLCFPLRKGLIAFAYINLLLSLTVASFLSMYIAYARDSEQPEVVAEYPRLIVDTVALVIEICMTVVFIVALHRKHVLLMRVYLYFEVVYSIIGFAYGIAFITRETASELFLILFQLMWQIYLAILIWSTVTKLERDDAVKYVRERDPA